MRGDERAHVPLNELLLAVEDIDTRIGHLAVHEQRHADVGHGVEHRRQRANVGDARVRVRGRTRRVKLARKHHTAGARRMNFTHRRRVGQVECHERLESSVARQRCEQALAVRARHFRGRYRRLEIRHHNGARELRRARGHEVA